MRFVIRNIRVKEDAGHYEEFDDFREDALNALAQSDFFVPEEEAPEAPPEPEKPLVLQLFAMLCVT